MDAFIGEIRAFPYSFVPDGWVQCDGRSLPVAAYPILAAVIGTTYGGDPASAINVPNLTGQAVIGAGTDAQGSVFAVSDALGEAAVTLTGSELPYHTHSVQTQYAAVRQTTPSADVVPAAPLYQSGGKNYNYNAYGLGGLTAMSPLAVGIAGGSQPHENRSPFLQFVYCINADAPDSVFPAQA